MVILETKNYLSGIVFKKIKNEDDLDGEEEEGEEDNEEVVDNPEEDDEKEIDGY